MQRARQTLAPVQPNSPPSPNNRLDNLEMLRGAAAVYVLLGHLVAASTSLNPASPLRFAFRFGQEAVMVFFLLSGFVIFHSTDLNTNKSFRSYFVRRSRRIFPIFLLALMFAWLLRATDSNASLKILAGNILMLQDFSWAKPGVWFDTFCGNLPLWSLSYEWWFYLLFFPIYRHCPESFQLPLAAVISAIGLIGNQLHPNQPFYFLEYFIIWWIGAELAKTRLRGLALNPKNCARCIVVLAAFCVALALPVAFAKIQGAPLFFGKHPSLELRHFGAALFGLCIALAWRRIHWIGFKQVFGIFSSAAGISYALYVFHYPMVITAQYLRGLVPSGLETLLYLAILIGASWFAEKPLQKWINRLVR